MSARLTCDVAVIGLGPAGAAAAADAAARGLRVIGVDRRKRAGEPVQCAEFVPALLGADAPVAETAVQSIAAMHTYVGAGPKHVEPNFPGAIISRAAFDAALAERARIAGAALLFGASVARIGGEGELELADGRVIDAQLIIGADGPRSLVGAATGRPNTELVETRQFTAPLLEAHHATDIFLTPALPGGYGWLFPKGGAANIGVGADAQYKPRLRAELERLHAALVEAGRVGREITMLTGGAIPVGGLRDPVAMLARRPALLAGDAAGLANPITGAGIAAAVVSGRMAGGAAADWAQGKNAALDAYGEELRDLFGPALARALRRRARLMAYYQSGAAPSPAALRAGWIAFPEYWTDRETAEKAHVLH